MEETKVVNKDFNNKNYVFAKVNVPKDLATKYSIHKGYMAGYATRGKKKLEADSQATALKERIAQIEEERLALIATQDSMLKNYKKILNSEIGFMIANEKDVKATNNIDNTVATYYMVNGFSVALKNLEGQYIILTNLIDKVPATEKQLALYEKYAMLRSTEPQNASQAKKLEKQIVKLYRKDPEFLDKYTASRLQYKLQEHVSNAIKEKTTKYEENVHEINKIANEQTEDAQRKLDTITQKYTRYTDRLVKQKEKEFIQNNADAIAAFADSLNLKVDRTNCPCIEYTNNGVKDVVSVKEFAIAKLLLNAKKAEYKGKMVSYVSKQRVQTFERMLENEILADRVVSVNTNTNTNNF